MDEYISKQRAKDLMGCCLASAKANYKAETSVFKKEQFKHYAETIEAMIDVVGAVEAADVQPVKHGHWEEEDTMPYDNFVVCSECGMNLSYQNYTKEEWQESFRHGGKKHCSVTVRCMQCHARSPVVGILMDNMKYDEREICEKEVAEAWNRRAGDENSG